MKRIVFVVAASLVFTVGLAGLAAAQFPIKIPKMPKVEKPKTESTQPTNTPSTSAPSTSSRGSAGKSHQYDFIRPTAQVLLVKDSIYIQAETTDDYWKTPGVKTSSWVPKVQFNVFYDWVAELPYVAEYFNPDGSLWFSEDLELGRPAADLAVRSQSKRDTTYKMRDTKSTTATGVYGIKITNSATKEVMFQGKFKIGKFPRPWKGKTSQEFYVDHDWLMPIGTVSFHFSNFSGQDLGQNFPVEVGMWFKKATGSTDHGREAKLFYKGQQIATTGRLQANETRASDTGNLSGELHHWARWDFQWLFDGRVGDVTIDNGGSYHPDNMPKSYFVDRNPGEYTVKVFDKGVQVREAKFTMGADGRIVDGGFHKPGYLTYHKVMIPVTIMAGAEKYNATAWKTEAFYGNPLTGFSVP